LIFLHDSAVPAPALFQPQCRGLARQLPIPDFIAVAASILLIKGEKEQPMPHYGILREYKLEEVDDVRGADVYGVNDEKLGTIDDVVFDHSNGEIRYIVLKTGGLLSRKRIMVPASRIEPYGNHDDKFYAELDKERLELLPEFNDDILKSEGNWSDYEKDYEDRWKTGEVMYNQDTGRIITPPAEEQLRGAPGQQLDQQTRESLRRDLTPQRMGKQDDYLGVASGTGKTTLQPQKPSIAGRESLGRENLGGEKLDRENLGRTRMDQEILGQESALGRQPAREVEGTMGTEFQVSQTPSASPMEAIREPGVYKLDAMPESGQVADVKRDVNESPNQALNANYGRRWMQFQQRLRDRRDKVVSGCNLCGTQDKAA
jgi:sporulation protein YlmC with PRC-barrel domain